jgi:hypothetical protein
MSGKASKKQLRYLSFLGKPEVALTGLTKLQASRLIDELIKSRPHPLRFSSGHFNTKPSRRGMTYRPR